jgi:uncharacterized protein (DUF736 family)
MPFQRDENELGALWIKESSRGEYLSGTINGESVVVFRNAKKRSENSPDWRVLKAQKRADRPATDAPKTDDPIPF